MSSSAGRVGFAGTEAEARDALRRAGERLSGSSLVGGRAGNLSLRLDRDRLLVTAAGSHLGRLGEDEVVAVGLEDGDPGGEPRPSSEVALHRAAHRVGRRIAAVVHTHAPALTAAGLRDLDLQEALPEVNEAVGGLAAVDFAPSGSSALARAAADALRRGAAVLLLRRHGAVTVGSGLGEAVDRTELAELAAYAALLAADAGLDLDLSRVTELHRRCHRRLRDRLERSGSP